MVPLLPWYLLQQHLRPLLTITLQLAISLTIPLELLLRPTLRLLRRSFPPNRQLYRLMRLGNQSRWRLSARADILEALYKAVMDFSKAVEAERGATESYDRTVVYLPALKIQVCTYPEEPEKLDQDEDDDDQPSSYFEAWAVLQEGNLLHSYISEALAQRMRLQQYPAPWDGALSCVDVLLKPATSEVGVPLEGVSSPSSPVEAKPLQLIVLPMEQFGRIDVRLASLAAEEAAAAIGRPLNSLNEQEDCLGEEGGTATAQLIIGQADFVKHFLPSSSSLVRCNGDLAFMNAGAFGNIVVGGRCGGKYRAYSAGKTIWLWLFALFFGPLFLLPAYLQLYLLCFILRWSPLFTFLNQILTPVVLLALFLLTGVRISLRCLEETEEGFWGSSFARWTAFTLDDLLLKTFYWLLDARHTLPELTEKESLEFRQYWYRWLKKLVVDGGLVPTLKASTPSISTSRNVHFSDQLEYLPEESRAEMGSDRKRYRAILRARILKPNCSSQEEVRILLNPSIDHSVITERAVSKLGLCKQAIWPRFQWGFYPREDDCIVCTEVVALQVAPYKPSSTSTVNLELLVVPRELTSDLPLPKEAQEALKTVYGVELSDTADESPQNLSHNKSSHHVDIVVGADQLYKAFFSGGEETTAVQLPGFESGLLRQTSFGAVFTGFEMQQKLVDGKFEEQKTFLDQLWQKWGCR